MEHQANERTQSPTEGQDQQGSYGGAADVTVPSAEDEFVTQQLAEAVKLYRTLPQAVEARRLVIRSTVVERLQVDTTCYPVGLVIGKA